MRWVWAAAATVAAIALAAPAPAALAPAQDPTVVRLPIPRDDGTLTPYTFETAYPLVTLVYDTLMWRDPGGRPQPWLAESVETDDEKVVIELRAGVRWHDGVALTASDVVFTFEFIAQRFHPRFTPQLEAIRSVRARDRRTVVMTLRHPAGGFTDQPLSDVPILPRHLWAGLPADAAAPAGRPVGTGPYRLVSHRPGRSYVLRAEPDYWGGAPLVDRLEIEVIPDFEATLRAFERRSVDMLPVSLSEDAQARAEGLGVAVERGPFFLGTVLLFNTTAPPFDDVEVRRAVADALDLRTLARGAGRAVAADQGFVHPESQWAGSEVLHTHDLDAAAGVLEDSELGPVEILVQDNDPVRAEVARDVGSALGRAGLDVRVRRQAYEHVAAAVGQDGRSADFQAAVWSSPALASYDPSFLVALFGEDAPLNYTGYASAEFERAARVVATATETEARRLAVQEELAVLARDVPAVPLYFTEGAFVYRAAVYDRWTYVHGSGILDKQSLLPGQRDRVRSPTPTPAPDASRAPESGGLGVPGMVAIGLAGAAVLLLAFGSLRRH